MPRDPAAPRARRVLQPAVSPERSHATARGVDARCRRAVRLRTERCCSGHERRLPQRRGLWAGKGVRPMRARPWRVHRRLQLVRGLPGRHHVRPGAMRPLPVSRPVHEALTATRDRCRAVTRAISDICLVAAGVSALRRRQVIRIDGAGSKVPDTFNGGGGRSSGSKVPDTFNEPSAEGARAVFSTLTLR
jgi:hypothetical protein